MTADTSAQRSCVGPNKVQGHKPVTRIPRCIATWRRNAGRGRTGIRNAPSRHEIQAVTHSLSLSLTAPRLLKRKLGWIETLQVKNLQKKITKTQHGLQLPIPEIVLRACLRKQLLLNYNFILKTTDPLRNISFIKNTLIKKKPKTNKTKPFKNQILACRPQATFFSLTYKARVALARRKTPEKMSTCSPEG